MFVFLVAWAIFSVILILSFLAERSGFRAQIDALKRDKDDLRAELLAERRHYKFASVKQTTKPDVTPNKDVAKAKEPDIVFSSPDVTPEIRAEIEYLRNHYE